MSYDNLPRMYRDLAPWFHLITAPADYKEEAAFYSRVLIEHCRRRPRHVLELGSGGGNNASHMKKRFEMTLVDLSPGMLRLSKTINPELEHRQGDMRTVRLGCEFDAVFIHDAIMYMTTEDDLRQSIETAYAHTKPGGCALFVPDCTRETFREKTRQGGHDDRASRRSVRFVEWTWDPDLADTTYNVEFAYLLRDARGRIRALRDRHTFGVFPKRTWLRLIRGAGFEAFAVPFVHSEVPPGYTVFVGKKRP